MTQPLAPYALSATYGLQLHLQSWLNTENKNYKEASTATNPATATTSATSESGGGGKAQPKTTSKTRHTFVKLSIVGLSAVNSVAMLIEILARAIIFTPLRCCTCMKTPKYSQLSNSAKYGLEKLTKTLKFIFDKAWNDNKTHKVYADETNIVKQVFQNLENASKKGPTPTTETSNPNPPGGDDDDSLTTS